MIRFFEEKDKTAVIQLWQEAFCEKQEDIAVFLEFVKDSMLVLEEDGRVVSMLTLMKTAIGEDVGRYIYAVATDKRFRSMGFASKLIDYAKQFVADNNEKFLTLVPREASLFDFYKKHGFCELFCAKKMEGKIEVDKDCKVKAEIIDAEDYADFRNAYFSGRRYVVWDKKRLGFMEKAYEGNFFALKRDNSICGAAFCYKINDLLIVAELLAKKDSLESINALGIFLGADRFLCIEADKKGDKFAMIYPREFQNTYFGLAMK